jgi:hypothetical protein
MFDSELSMVVILTLLYEDLDNVFALPNLQIPSFKISQLYLLHFKTFALISSQNKLLS